MLMIDQRRRCAILDNREIQLTPQEYRILTYLAERSGAVVEKQSLTVAMWGTETTVDAATVSNPVAVDLVIFRLRKKLGDPAQTPRYIETRRGFGYILHNAQLLFAAAPNVDERHPVPALPKLIERPLLVGLPDRPTESIDSWSSLTHREWELFMQLGQEETVQLTNRALARRLAMAENTLKKHLQNLYRKLAVSNRAAAAILSARVQLQLYSEQQLMKGRETMNAQQEEQNKAIVQCYYQALVARDTAVIAPYLADDVMRIGVIFPDERPVITRGKEQLLARIQRVIDDNGTTAVSQLQVNGNKVICHVKIATDMSRADGSAPLEEDVEFLLQDGKIHSFKVVSTPDSAAKIRAVKTH